MGGWGGGGTNAAADITRSGSHSFLFREGGRAVWLGRFLAGDFGGRVVNVTERRS